MPRSSNDQIPVDFGLALSQNVYAMEYFASLSEGQQRDIIEQSKAVSTSAEMYNYVNALIPH